MRHVMELLGLSVASKDRTKRKKEVTDVASFPYHHSQTHLNEMTQAQGSKTFLGVVTDLHFRINKILF